MVAVDGGRWAVDGGAVQTQRTPEATRRLLVEDVFTPSVSRTPALVQNLLYASVCENACASSLTVTLCFLIEDRCPLSRPLDPASCCGCDVPSCEEASHIANDSVSRVRTNEAGSSPTGARSVGDCSLMQRSCQAICDADAKNFSKFFARAKVSSPNRFTSTSHL
jgi:hypothetical protein